MENERFPNDPYRSGLSDDEFGRPSRLERDAQVDPELTEGPASNGKIALFAIAIAVVLGAVFYGLNNTNVHEATNAPPPQSTQQQANPAQPPGAATNTQPGMTTGAAPASRPSAPQAAPKGTDASGNPPAPSK